MGQLLKVKVTPEELAMLRLMTRDSLKQLRKEKESLPDNYKDEIEFHKSLLERLEHPEA